jgi:hypothetical protein
MVKKVPNRKKPRRILDDETEIQLGDNGPIEGGSDADVVRFAGELNNIDKRMELLAREKRRIRNSAKAAGCILKHLDKYRREMEVEPETHEKEIKTSIRYARLLGVPLFTQMDLFDELPPVPPNGDDMARAADAGKRAGLMDQPPKTNPYEPGSDLGQRWLEFYHIGQEELTVAREMQKRADAAAAMEKTKAKTKSETEEMEDA